MKHDTVESSIPKEVITYTAAFCESRIAEIARNTNQPEQELREWVAIFLLSSWTGISNYMPSLRRGSAKVHPTTRKMAVANNSHSESQAKPSDSSHQVNAMKGKKYKPGTHWMQKPENKERLKKQAKKARQAYLAKRKAA